MALMLLAAVIVSIAGFAQPASAADEWIPQTATFDIEINEADPEWGEYEDGPYGNNEADPSTAGAKATTRSQSGFSQTLYTVRIVAMRQYVKSGDPDPLQKSLSVASSGYMSLAIWGSEPGAWGAAEAEITPFEADFDVSENPVVGWAAGPWSITTGTLTWTPSDMGGYWSGKERDHAEHVWLSCRLRVESLAGANGGSAHVYSYAGATFED